MTRRRASDATPPARRTAVRWAFTARLRASGFGPYASKLAIERLREAVTEVRRVAKEDASRGAEGAVLMCERLWPAFEQVDSSSGALGTAVRHALDALLPLVVAAVGDAAPHARRLDRLWDAMEADGVGYLDPVGDRWGELCASPHLASAWADRLLPSLRASWARDRGTSGYFRGTSACLSALVAAGRHDELLAPLETAPFVWWHHRRYGVRALAAQGRVDEALRYAETSRGLNDDRREIDLECEALLLSAGRAEEAYARYALTANVGANHLATFRAIARKYPHREAEAILRDLLAASPGAEGRWFATAHELGLRPLALELARARPVDPRTLTRAARGHVTDDPRFALELAIAAIEAIGDGAGYEIAGADVYAAWACAVEASSASGAPGEAAARVRAIVASERPYTDFVARALPGVSRAR